MLRQFGAKNGMVLCPASDALVAYTNNIIDKGYGYSRFHDPANSGVFDRYDVCAMLCDWGWVDAQDKRPKWYINYSKYPWLINGIHIDWCSNKIIEICESKQTIQFKLEVTLTEDHVDYVGPIYQKRQCSREAIITFSNCSDINWAEKNFISNSKANVMNLYDKIDTFYMNGNRYCLSGEWGDVSLRSDPPRLDFVT